MIPAHGAAPRPARPSIAATIAGPLGFASAVLVGFLWTPIAGMVVAALTLLYTALLLAGMPAASSGSSVDPYLAQVMRWRLVTPPRPSGTPGIRALGEAVWRIMFSVHTWILAAGTVLLVGATTLFAFYTISGVLSSTALYVTLVLVYTVFVPPLIAGSLAELDGRPLSASAFIPSRGWPKALMCSFIAIVCPSVAAYLVLDVYASLFDLQIAWEQQPTGNTIVGLVGLVAALVAAMMFVPLRWAAYFAIKYDMPIGGCIVESVRAARVHRWRQALPVVAVTTFTALSVLVGRALVETATSWIFLFAGLGVVPLALVVLTLAGGIDFKKLCSEESAPVDRQRHPVTGPLPGVADAVPPPPLSTVQVPHSRPAPRGSLLAIATLILYPVLNTIALGVNAQIQTGNTRFTASLSPDTALILMLCLALLSLVPSVLAAMTVLRSRRDIWVPQGWIRALVAVAFLAQLGAAVAQAITTGSVAAADAGPYLFLGDFLSASAFVAAWLLGHRRVRATAGLAIVSGFIVAVVTANLNQQLGMLGSESAQTFVEVTTVTTAIYLTGVSAIFAATAWIAYAIELVALRHERPPLTY